MTIFNLADLNPGTWFTLDDGEGRVCLRVCTGDDLREIRKRTVKERVEYKRGQRFAYEVVDEKLQNELIWQHCIVDWERLIDQNGESIPCTPENKILLMGRSIKFAGFVADCLETLTEIDAAHEEEAKKNA